MGLWENRRLEDKILEAMKLLVMARLGYDLGSGYNQERMEGGSPDIGGQ